MKKFFISIVSLILILVIFGFIIWFNFPNIASNFLTKEFNVPVSVRNITFFKNNINIYKLNIGTPPQSKTDSSFYSKKININTKLLHIKKDTLLINSLSFDDNIITVELYNRKGTDNNWTRILSTPSNGKNGSKRDYIIKKIILNNTSLVLIKPDGQKQILPTIEKMEFENLTNESGFPIEEIEKAISDKILRHVLDKYNLLNLLKTPVKIIEKVLPIPGFR